jgi:hypothetical protein
VPPAEAPPAALLSDAPLSLLPLDEASSLALASSLDEPEVPSLDLAVEVVEVEVVCTAAFSALVSVGGVMSGVLFGTASLTLLPPPQAARLTGQNSRMLAAIAARADGRWIGRADFAGWAAGLARGAVGVLITRAGGILISEPEALN